ncbi:MAG: YncE family protein [bacterium]
MDHPRVTRLASLSAVTLALVAGSLVMSAAPAQAFTEGGAVTTPVGIQPEGAAQWSTLLAVSNAASNSLSIIDTNTMVVTDTISGLGAPTSVAITGVPPSLRYLVTESFPTALSVIDGLTPSATIPLPGTAPVQVVVSPADPNLWIVVDALGSVIRHDGTAGAPVPLSLGGNPWRAVFSEGGDTLYVLDAQGELIAVDVATMTRIQGYPIGGFNLTGVALIGDRAFISSQDGLVYRINLLTGAVRAFTLGGTYTSIQPNWFGRYLYLTNRDVQTLDIITASGGLLVTSLPLAATPLVLVTPQSGEDRDVFVVNRDANSVSKLTVNPDPPGRPTGWVSKSCTLASGRVTARLQWQPASSPGDLALEGYRFQLKKASGTWGRAKYTRRVETNGTLTTRGYRVGQRITVRVQSLSLAGSSGWLRGTCTVRR